MNTALLVRQGGLCCWPLLGPVAIPVPTENGPHVVLSLFLSPALLFSSPLKKFGSYRKLPLGAVSGPDLSAGAQAMTEGA